MTLTFSIIQSSLFWEDKEANLRMFSQKINEITASTQIIVLPEMFSTGFSMRPEIFAEDMNGTEIQWMKKIAKSRKVIVTGSVMIKENDDYVNRLIWMLPNETYGYYDKRHCFAYAKENLHYTPGKRKLLAQVNKFKINTQICYDLRFPVWARQEKNNEYDVLLYVANWPARRSYAWKSLLIARAIENQCYVIAVNRVGIDGNGIEHNGCSMIVDPLGEIIYLKENVEDVFTYTIFKEKISEIRTKFPFLSDADSFNIIH